MNKLEQPIKTIQDPINPTLNLLIKFLTNPILYFGSTKNCEEYFKLLNKTDHLLAQCKK